jgi:DNA topoisomerase-3
MRKLLAEGKTDLLLGFVSSRTRRKFKAFLVRGPTARSASSSPPGPRRARQALAPRPQRGRR